MELFEHRTDYEDKHLTEKVGISTLQSFEDKGVVTYPLNSIVNRLGIHIEWNKRNYRKQSVHIKCINNQRAFKVETGECINRGNPKGSGNKSKNVREWRKAHPDCKKIDWETGVSRHTV